MGWVIFMLHFYSDPLIPPRPPPESIPSESDTREMKRQSSKKGRGPPPDPPSPYANRHSFLNQVN